MPLFEPRIPIRRCESGDNYTIGFSGISLTPFPLDQWGFPIWPGVWTKWGITHAAGAYQFQPGTWRLYAQPLGIHDFSVTSQDAVAASCFQHQAFQPWAPYDAKLAAFITAKGGPSMFAIGGANPYT
jgi:hypothetical protein